MFESRRVKTIIIFCGIAVVAAVFFSASSLVFTTPHIAQTQNSSLVQAPQPVQLGPPAPMPITVWGKQDTLEHAKNVTGMSWVSLPTQIPSNLTLAPIRVENDPRVAKITAIYTPIGVVVSDNDTGEQIANAGGFSITYWREIGGPTANVTKNMEIVTKEFPNTTSLDTINGRLALIFPNEIQINAGNCMSETNCWLVVDIGSRTLNSTELRPIAESIAILPHD